MSDVACALEALKCAYQTAFNALEKDPRRAIAIREKLLQETAAPFKKLHALHRREFFDACKQRFDRVFPGQFPAPQTIRRAVEEGKLTSEGIVPTDPRQLKSHLGIVHTFALPKTAEFACVSLAA